MCVYIYTSDCVQTVYELPFPPNDKAKYFYTNLERCEVLTGCLSLGACLAVTGRIRDIGQNVLESSFQTGSSSSPITAIAPSLSHFSRRTLVEI